MDFRIGIGYPVQQSKNLCSGIGASPSTIQPHLSQLSTATLPAIEGCGSVMTTAYAPRLRAPPLLRPPPRHCRLPHPWSSNVRLASCRGDSPGKLRGNHKHHDCNETFLIWGAATRFGVTSSPFPYSTL
ncbi:hypothetical protein Fmac_010314 [Flemingia macrophylla]|uniref:Uncharacterized protein n=1 Tax=Flemingia macrophylla TaxID=520843 RepID=A0ABD1MK32_9FABA